jgi:hypothetical protein
LDPVIVNAGESMQVQVVSDDVDGDNETLRYVLDNAPAGMQVSGEGLIQWSVDNEAESATHSVTVIVLDGENAMGKQLLVVTVFDCGALYCMLGAAVKLVRLFAVVSVAACIDGGVELCCGMLASIMVAATVFFTSSCTCFPAAEFRVLPAYFKYVAGLLWIRASSSRRLALSGAGMLGLLLVFIVGEGAG